jgi:hypothetical protein
MPATIATGPQALKLVLDRRSKGTEVFFENPAQAIRPDDQLAVRGNVSEAGNVPPSDLRVARLELR